MKSEAVTPLVFDNITEAAFEAAVAANGGEVTKSDGTITSAYITFIVPKDATPEEIMGALETMLKKIDKDKLWVNPDCGLKTRGILETEASLINLVEAAKILRKQY